MAVKSPSEIWRDYVTDGVPSSGKHNPVKGDIRAWAESLQAQVSYVYNDLAALNANLVPVAGSRAEVREDNDSPSNNGIYQKVGGTGTGSWTKIDDLPDVVADNDITNAKLANMAEARIKGRVSSGSGDPEDLTAAQVRTIINVEDAADVTDATNVGSSIHGSSSKTTPVDADTFAGIDSAASNVLKKFTWANVKAAMKAYLDPFLDEKASIADVTQRQGRPGDASLRFASTLTGAGSAASTTSGSITNNTFGAVLRVTGAAIVGTRERVAVEAGRRYRIRWVIRRQTNPTDPAGDTVRCGIQWLTNAKADNGQLTDGSLDTVLTVANGRLVISTIVADDDPSPDSPPDSPPVNDGVNYEWPASTRYMVPFVQTYGSDGVTDIELIEWTDITDLASVEVDISDAVAAALSSKQDHSANLDTWSAVSTAPISKGGTGQTTARAALDALQVQGTNITVASSVNLAAADGDLVLFVGAGDVDTLGNAGASATRTIIAQDGFTLKASVNILTPDGEDIVLPAGAAVVVKSRGSGIWQIVSHPGNIVEERTERKELIDEPGGGAGTGVYLTDGKVVVGGEVTGGAVLAAFKGDESYIGELHLKEQDVPGPIRLTDEDGRIPDDASVVDDRYPSSLLPFFGPYLCGVEGEKLTIHLAGLLANREDDAPKAWMELSSLETRAIVDGTKSMTFLPEEFGSNARLIIRPQFDDGASFAELQLTVAVLPQPPDSPAITKRVCYIGDSLLYRQGAPIISKKLETDWGMVIAETGTLATEATATYPSGVLSEAKPGHALYDFVYFYGADGTQQPLADANIPYYLGSSSPAWSTTQKRNVNYWLRPESGDDPEDVVNGYVLDFAWGFSRMSLTAPDALIIDYFRNDSNGMTAEEIEDFFYDHVLLICRRWEADYGTSAPIFWIVPDCGFSVVSEQNYKRDTRDVAAMRGIYKAAQDTTAKLIIVPAHALSSPYSQYDLEAITEPADPITGAYLRNFKDPVHMTGGGRLAPFEHSAMWIACGLAGLL